jgi:hypothetical protein
VFQGRYKAFPIEDEGYYWNLSRYIHLNPCHGSKPLAATEAYRAYRSAAGGRDVAAMLCRRWTTATLRELSGRFGLSHPDSAADLIKRGKRLADSNRDVARNVASIETALGLNPESQFRPRRSPPA